MSATDKSKLSKTFLATAAIWADAKDFHIIQQCNATFTTRDGKMCPKWLDNFSKGPHEKRTVEGCCHPTPTADAVLQSCPPLPRPLCRHTDDPPHGPDWDHPQSRSDPEGPCSPAMVTIFSNFIWSLDLNFFKNCWVYVLPFKEKKV